MDTTVREHINRLEELRQSLTVGLMKGNKSLHDRNKIEAEIRAATLAIEYFRAALEAERSLRP